jgi:hypothetical protein
MPCVATIFNWLRIHPAFLEQYTRAKEEQADALAEDMLDIADDGTNDWMKRRSKDGILDCEAGYLIVKVPGSDPPPRPL